MARCLRNCEECEFSNTCNESLTVEAIEKRVGNKPRDFTKFNDGKGEEMPRGIKLKDYIDTNKNLFRYRGK